MTIAPATLAILLDLLVIFIGARFFAVPIAAATAFGVPVRTDGGGASAYLTVKGLRDTVSGVVGLLFAA